MVALVETIWLFSRGGDSVRMIRGATPEGRARLLVYGPGNTQAVYEFDDAVECSTQEAEVEQQLVAEGYTLEQFTDRRSGMERRAMPRASGPERRRRH